MNACNIQYMQQQHCAQGPTSIVNVYRQYWPSCIKHMLYNSTTSTYNIIRNNNAFKVMSRRHINSIMHINTINHINIQFQVLKPILNYISHSQFSDASNRASNRVTELKLLHFQFSNFLCNSGNRLR